MGRIITISSSKGGSAKSAWAMCLSANLAAQRYRVAVVDADPNQSFANWHKLYTGAPMTCTVEPRDSEIVDHAQEQAKNHDVVIVDTAGFNNSTAAFAAGTADMVLIPVMPDRSSVTEAMRTARQVQNFSKAARRNIPNRIVRARWNPKGLVERALDADLARAGLQVLAAHLPSLTDFGKLTLTGTVPLTGRVGSQIDRALAELVALGAIPERRRA